MNLHQHPFSVRTVFDRVIDQVVKEARQKISVCRDNLARDIALQLVGEVFVLEARIKFLQQLAEQFDDVHLRHVHCHFSIIHFSKTKQIFDQFFQTFRFCIGNINIFFLHFCRNLHLAGQKFKIADDRGQRCPQIVCHIGNQLVLRALRLALLVHQIPDIPDHLI